jgi:hypothetical protein
MEIDDNFLYEKHDRLTELMRETYDRLYTRCVKTIKLASNSGELMCTFEIPPLLFGSGYPKVNVENCAEFIIKKLTNANKNISTAFVTPNLIYIDWRRKY